MTFSYIELSRVSSSLLPSSCRSIWIDSLSHMHVVPCEVRSIMQGLDCLFDDQQDSKTYQYRLMGKSFAFECDTLPRFEITLSGWFTTAEAHNKMLHLPERYHRVCQNRHLVCFGGGQEIFSLSLCWLKLPELKYRPFYFRLIDDSPGQTPVLPGVFGLGLRQVSASGNIYGNITREVQLKWRSWLISIRQRDNYWTNGSRHLIEFDIEIVRQYQN